MIKKVYRSDLEPDFIVNRRNILSFELENKNDELPLLVISWRLLWQVIKNKIKGRRVMLCIHSSYDHNKVYYDFFRMIKQ